MDANHLAHFVEQFRLRVIVPPAAGIEKFDQMLLPALDQGEPSARELSYGLACRSDMEKAKAQIETPLNRRWTLIGAQLLNSAIEMNVAPRGAIVDFQFVDKTVQK